MCVYSASLTVMNLSLTAINDFLMRSPGTSVQRAATETPWHGRSETLLSLAIQKRVGRLQFLTPLDFASLSEAIEYRLSSECPRRGTYRASRTVYILRRG